LAASEGLRPVRHHSRRWRDRGRERVSGTVKGALSRVNAGNGVSLAETDAVASNNGYGIGEASSAVTVRNLPASANSVGVAADQSAAEVRVAQSTITDNGTG
jgi:hypothetical protein